MKEQIYLDFKKRRWIEFKINALLKPFSNRQLSRSHYEILLRDLCNFCEGEIRLARSTK